MNGLWTGEFNANVNNITIGVGVLIFKDGKVFGGNATNYLVGHYETDGTRIQGQMQGTHYAGDPITPMGIIPAESSHQLDFKGEIRGRTIHLDASPAGQTVVRVKGALTQRCDASIFAEDGPPSEIDGLWTGEYNANVNNICLGHSVLAVYRGRIFGGNATFYQTGGFTGGNDQIIGETELVHYAGEPLTIVGAIEPFSTMKMRYKGTFNGGHLALDIEPEDHTVVRVKGDLNRRLDARIFS